jgi:hypothetical protein
MYAVEFMCLSLAELMVLERMSDFAMSRTDGYPRRWKLLGRAVLGAVLAGDLVGVSSSISAATRLDQIASIWTAASRECAVNNTVAGLELSSHARESNQIALAIASVQSFSEVAILLLIVASFVCVGVACARRVSATLHGISAPAAVAASVATTAGRKLHLQIVLTTVFVFAAFVLRSVYSALHAVANELQNSGNSECPDSYPSLCDRACYNDYALIGRWMMLTPELQIIVVFVSSPLALVVALWGMTPKHTLRQMRLSRRTVSRTREPFKSNILHVSDGSTSGGVSMHDSLMANSRVQRPGDV